MMAARPPDPLSTVDAMSPILAAQARDPFDAAPMLIHADWLEEQGDQVGAEVLRGLAAARIPSLLALAFEATLISKPSMSEGLRFELGSEAECGFGSGDGTGAGYGSGIGDGTDEACGIGYGYCDQYGLGAGYGPGEGDGFGQGYGYGFGDGHRDRDGEDEE
jgi:uncharacterized protein (TIGR02996 family)